MRLLFSTLIVPAALIATQAQAKEDTQHWETLNVTVNLPDNFKLNSESIFRSGEARGFYEIEQNVMVGKKVDKKVTVWLGYTFNPTYNQGEFRAREHRFRQQVNFDNVAQLGKIKLGGRVRMEERWREGHDGTAWRLRPQVKASMPFVGKSTFTVSHESFINLNTTTFQTVNGYERMRNAASVSVPVAKNVGIDLGYLNQHGFVRNGEDTSDNVLTLGLSATF